MDDETKSEEAPQRRPNVFCGDCGGTGTRVEPRAYVGKTGAGESLMAPTRCRSCRGKGTMSF